MGDVIRYVQTATISTGGTYETFYVHDPRGKPSRVGLISASLESGTQTGVVQISIGNDITNTAMIERFAFTANNPCVALNPNFVIQPGMVIRFKFSNITGGDVARISVVGH